MTERKIGEIRSTKKIEGIICCPRCGSLVGLKFKPPKVEKIRFKIGDKELPTIDMQKLENLELIIHCPDEACRHTFKRSEAIIKPPEKEEDHR